MSSSVETPMQGKPKATRYVAFLKGINVGGHRVKMDVLRDLFKALNFSEVATFIASGNVFFETFETDAIAIEQRIETHLKQSLGYQVDTFVRTTDELAAIVGLQPFAFEEMEAPGHTVHVGFLRDPLAGEIEKKLVAFRTDFDEFRIQGREFYWLCRGKTTDSKVSWPVVAKTVKTSSTMRNLTTVRKIAGLYPPS